MDRYTQLTQTLKTAAEAARKIAEVTDDNGTCNFDSIAVNLKQSAHNKVTAAVSLAGLNCWYCEQIKCWIVGVPVPAQANKRTAQAKAMCKVMQEAGYPAGMYYQMD